MAEGLQQDWLGSDALLLWFEHLFLTCQGCAFVVHVHFLQQA